MADIRPKMAWRRADRFPRVLTALQHVLLVAYLRYAAGQFSSTLTCQKGNLGTDIIELCTGSGTLGAGEQVL